MEYLKKTAISDDYSAQQKLNRYKNSVDIL